MLFTAATSTLAPPGGAEHGSRSKDRRLRRSRARVPRSQHGPNRVLRATARNATASRGWAGVRRASTTTTTSDASQPAAPPRAPQARRVTSPVHCASVRQACAGEFQQDGPARPAVALERLLLKPSHPSARMRALRGDERLGIAIERRAGLDRPRPRAGLQIRRPGRGGSAGSATRSRGRTRGSPPTRPRSGTAARAASSRAAAECVARAHVERPAITSE
jgi:hypothetical protein